MRHLTDLEREILGQRLLHLQLQVPSGFYLEARMGGFNVISSWWNVRERIVAGAGRNGGAGGVRGRVGQGDGDGGNHRPRRVVDMSYDGAAGLRQQRGSCQQRKT